MTALMDLVQYAFSLTFKHLLIYFAAIIKQRFRVPVVAASTDHTSIWTLTMKKIIAIAALIASSQASAFWGWDNSNTNTQGKQAGNTQAEAEASAEAEMIFDFTFTGRGKGKGFFQGTGDNANDWNGYQADPYNPAYPIYGTPPAR